MTLDNNGFLKSFTGDPFSFAQIALTGNDVIDLANPAGSVNGDLPPPAGSRLRCALSNPTARTGRLTCTSESNDETVFSLCPSDLFLRISTPTQVGFGCEEIHLTAFALN